MADLRTIKYWLALQLAFGVGSGKLGGVLELTDSAIDFYRGGERLWSRNGCAAPIRPGLRTF